MRAAKRSAAVLPPALKPSFKAHQDHVEQIIDVLGGVIILYPDNLITFSFQRNFTPAITVALSRASPHPLFGHLLPRKSAGEGGVRTSIRLSAFAARSISDIETLTARWFT